MYFESSPIGVNPPDNEKKQPVWKVTSGDEWFITTRVYLPVEFVIPATPTNSRVTFKLAQDRFSDKPIWTGVWGDTIEEVNPQEHPGLIIIRIPDEISSRLRRGSYAFSLTVSDVFGRRTTTVLSGSLLVEYEPTSPNHDIPYRRFIT